MSDSSVSQVVADFILASPPGEINDVFNDIRAIVNDDELLQDCAITAFQKYNETNFLSTFLQGEEIATVISQHAIYEEIPEEEVVYYLNPRTSVKYTFDHILQKVTEQESVPRHDEKLEKSRSEVESAVDKYILEHFKDGSSSTFINKDYPDVYTVTISNQRYNPSNFWNGRWKSEYNLNTRTGTVEGKINILVHYYEDGNVQLNVEKIIKTNVATDEYRGSVQDFALLAFKSIKENELAFQQALNEKFQNLSETSFKQLRRVLPVTRNKINWESIANYKIGNELTR